MQETSEQLEPDSLTPHTPIYTVGYARRSVEQFIALLHQYEIKYLVDIRSQPYSSANQQFSKGPLEKVLKRHHIGYLRKKLKNGEEEMDERKAYPSDLTDAEWEILEPLIPAISEEASRSNRATRDCQRHSLRLRSGCPWRLMPHDLPAWGTVYYYFRAWRKASIWDKALQALRKQMRKSKGEMKSPVLL